MIFSCVQCPGEKNLRHYTGNVTGQGFSTNPTVQTCKLQPALPTFRIGFIQHTQHKINTEPPPSELWFHQTPFWYHSNMRVFKLRGATPCPWSYHSFTPEKAQREIFAHRHLLCLKASPPKRHRRSFSSAFGFYFHLCRFHSAAF